MQLKQVTQQNREPTCIITIGAKTDTDKSSFIAILTQAIDEAFSTLGCKQNIYSQLETKYAITQTGMAENPDAFVAALRDMFGESSLLIELKIMGLLHIKAPKVKYYLRAEEELNLSSYIKNLKFYLM